MARDAAKKLGNAKMCVVLWIDETGERLGMASYGKSVVECEEAKGLGDVLYEKAMDYITAVG